MPRSYATTPAAVLAKAIPVATGSIAVVVMLDNLESVVESDTISNYRSEKYVLLVFYSIYTFT
jgi:hypothetical protein